MDYIDLKYQKPYKGQIVETLSWMPAIYQGVNDMGSDEWLLFRDLEAVVCWKIPGDDHVVYSYVQQKLRDRNDKGEKW